MQAQPDVVVIWEPPLRHVISCSQPSTGSLVVVGAVVVVVGVMVVGGATVVVVVVSMSDSKSTRKHTC